MKGEDVQEPCFELLFSSLLYLTLLVLTEMAPRRLLYFYCMHPLRTFDVVLSLFSFDVPFRLYGGIHHIHLNRIELNCI